MKLLIKALLLAAVFGAAANAQQPQPGELTYALSTTSSGADVIPTLTWSTNPAASRCVAGQDWTGEKGAAGTQTLPATQPPKSYLLTCFWDDTDARLTWVAPTTNVDGTTLTNLAGYRIYYGQAQANLNQTVAVNDPAATTRTITDLTLGQWFFSMTAMNAQGIESARTNLVNITLTSAQTARTMELRFSTPAPPTDVAVD